MIFNTFFVTVQLAAAAICAAAGHPNHSSIETIAQIKRELMLAPRSDNVIFSKSTKLDSSIEEFPLFKLYEIFFRRAPRLVTEPANDF